jgi:hypothetical protein
MFLTRQAISYLTCLQDLIRKERVTMLTIGTNFNAINSQVRLSQPDQSKSVMGQDKMPGDSAQFSHSQTFKGGMKTDSTEEEKQGLDVSPQYVKSFLSALDNDPEKCIGIIDKLEAKGNKNTKDGFILYKDEETGKTLLQLANASKNFKVIFRLNDFLDMREPEVQKQYNELAKA